VAAGQVGLFDGDGSSEDSTHDPLLPELPELPKKQLLAYEKELLGFYLTEHPMAEAMKRLSESAGMKINEITPEKVGSRVSISGIVVSVKKIVTKASNSEMAFARIEDLTGSVELVVFPKVYARTTSLWTGDIIVSASGKVDEKDDRLTILVDDVKLVN